MRNLTIASLLVAGAVANAQVIIDDFSFGYAKTISSGSYVDSMSGAFLGGERDVELRVNSNPFNQQMDLTITGGQLAVVSQGFNLLGKFTLQYDAQGDETVGVNQALNNSSNAAAPFLAGQNTVRVKFLDNDLPVQVIVKLRNSGSVVASQSQTRAGAAGAGNMDFVFNQGDMDSAKSLSIEFVADRSGDYALEGVEAVPEPATLIALGAGALALLRRRSR